MSGENDDRGARWKRALSQPLEMWSWIEMNSRQDVDARHSMRSDMARLPIRGMTLNRAWTAYLPRFPVTRVPR